MKTAYFERFALDMPDEAVADCHHQGACDEDVEHWSKANRIQRPPEITPEVLRAELKEELADDDANWRRIIWLAAGNIQDEEREEERHE